jgi:hypothetical protein
MIMLQDANPHPTRNQQRPKARVTGGRTGLPTATPSASSSSARSLSLLPVGGCRATGPTAVPMGVPGLLHSREGERGGGKSDAVVQRVLRDGVVGPPTPGIPDVGDRGIEDVVGSVAATSSRSAASVAPSRSPSSGVRRRRGRRGTPRRGGTTSKVERRWSGRWPLDEGAPVPVPGGRAGRPRDA